MKKIVLFCFCIGITVMSFAKDIETQSVLLQALDKTTGRTQFLTLKVEEPYVYGDLTVRVEKCLKRPPEETPENSVYLTVLEKGEQEIFKGWMFSSNPALSSMEHPVYDIWVVECKEKGNGPVAAPVFPTEDVSDDIDIDSLED